MTEPPAQQTKRTALAQLAFCVGCCCGRVDRGFPKVPVEDLKTVWKAEKLNSTVQLTISGCLGPCDMTNVTLLITPTGNTWLGHLRTPEEYQLIVQWARACKQTQSLLALPHALAQKQFERFPLKTI